MVPFRLIKLRSKTGLNIEMLPTEHAIATYNYMCDEGRAVGAALIPPLQVRTINTFDFFQQRKNLYGEDMYNLPPGESPL